MFCPKCGCEYREGFDTCADCHVPLVPELPESPEPREDPDDPELEFIYLASSYNLSDIAIIRSYFEAEGIQFFVEGETFNLLQPLVQPARILVVRKDINAAREILENLDLRHTTHLTIEDDVSELGE